MARKGGAKGVAKEEELNPEALESRRLTERAFDLGVRCWRGVDDRNDELRDSSGNRCQGGGRREVGVGAGVGG